MAHVVPETERDVPRWLAEAYVDQAVTELRPDYAALLIVVEELRPGPSDDESDKLLTAAESRARTLLDGRAPHELDHLRQWREAFQAFGAKPQRTRLSAEALLRRVEAGLPRVDRITDAYNAVSVGHLLPVGGEDLDTYAGPVRLVRATGEETFDTQRDGETALEHPDPGEVVWRDDEGVTCRRWNWRQCVRTRITHSTTRGLFILDGLAALGPDGLKSAAEELIANLTRLSPGATAVTRLLAPTESG